MDDCVIESNSMKIAVNGKHPQQKIVIAKNTREVECSVDAVIRGMQETK